MAALVRVLSIEVEKKIQSVVGGDFQEMLAAIKEIKGRKWDGDRKVWILPCSLDEAKQALDPYRVGEDEVLEEEISEVVKYQQWILKDVEAIQAEIARLDKLVAGYSYNSVSRIKAGFMSNSGCLRHALNYAKLPIEKLADPQILTIRKACKLMGWE